MVSLLSLVPLVFTLVLCLAAVFFILKRKALAQAHCVQEAVRMQTELKDTLEKLLKLNREAAILRQRRLVADRAVISAASSANPYALAAAKATQLAVILQQTAFRARQEKLLLEARRQRQKGQRELKSKLVPLNVNSLDSHGYYWRALAVEAKPPSSLTPNFEPLPAFSWMQQHRFQFQLGLEPPLSLAFVVPSLRQSTECAVTITGKENAWNVRILAASARSKWP